MTTKIHHATQTKADKLNIELTIVGDTLRAVDNDHPDAEPMYGDNAAKLLLDTVERREAIQQEETTMDDTQTEMTVLDEDLSDEGDEGEQEDDEGEQEDDEGEQEDDEGEQEDDEGDTADNEEPVASSSIVKRKYVEMYEPFNASCGDAFALAFEHACHDEKGKLDLDRLITVGFANDVNVEDRWGERNNGQKRMNLSNVLRAKVRNGVTVTVGDATFNPEPKEEKPAKAKRVTKKEAAAAAVVAQANVDYGYAS